MLLARRLCEAGCGFITVSSPGWDMHGAHEFAITDGMPVLGPAVDKAVSAFIEDIESRGLTEKVLLVITGEFGRTPKINSKGGRDHWGNLCPLVFVGGGLKMGQVIGESDKNGVTPLHHAIRFRSPMAVKTLIERGAKVDQCCKRSEATPLHRAATSTGAPGTAGKAEEMREIIRFLLESDANPSIKNKWGKLPLDYVKD